ncbi:MAG TPA: acyl-CoA desaturase, partial [Solimonas sp.]
MNPATRSRPLNPEELDRFGAELDALRTRVVADLGAADARYVRNVVKAVRWSALSGRVLLAAGAIGLLFTPWGWLGLVSGTMALTLAKILENMELGHNVMPGQYDWMRDPHL